MPELPDVERFKRYFDATGLRQTIDATSVMDDRILEDTSPQGLGRILKGARFESTRRHGKFLLAATSHRDWLVFHFGMSGDLHYGSHHDELPPYARLAIVFTNGNRLVYTSKRMLGKIGHTDDPEGFADRQNLGPDAMDSKLKAGDFVRLMRDRRGGLKSALMNQSVLAGIGNIYSDEICFQAGLHPAAELNTLDGDTLTDVYRVMRRVLQTASRHNGHTDQFPSRYLIPHRDKSDACPQCGQAIARDTIAGRTSYFCPACQPAPR